MHENQVYRKHSDEFRDVIEKFPKKSNKMLLILLIAIVIIGFILGWFIKSPDIILAEINVTAEKPPIALVSKLSGNVKLKTVNFGKTVYKGDYIAIIQNSADEDQVKELKSILSKFSFDSIPKFVDYSFALNYNLGELQNTYFEFVNTIYQLNQFYDNNKYELEINSLRNQIGKINNSIEKRNEIISIKDDNIELSEKYTKSDSILASKGAIVRVDYEKSKQELLRKLELKAVEENEIIRNRLNIVTLKNKMSSLSIDNIQTLESLNLTLLTTYQKLISGINLWEQNYVFIAPVEGKLEYLKFLTNNQFVKQGEAIFSVLPLDNKIIGQALLPSQGAGKVKKGQKVTIKLDTYPYQEFGSISGEVQNISLIPLEKTYLVNISLSHGLISDSGIELNFSKEMSGQAEIITDKRRLISRLFERLKYMFDKKRENTIINTDDDKTKNN